jgi:hypothetical protein
MIEWRDGRRLNQLRLFVLDDPELAAQAVQAVACDAQHVRELAVEDEARNQQRVGLAEPIAAIVPIHAPTSKA